MAHVGSLARDSKQKDTVSYAELLGWLKWPTGRVKRTGDDTEETAKSANDGAQQSVQRKFTLNLGQVIWRRK